MDGLGLFPGAGVRVEGVTELLAAFVRDLVGPGCGAEEREAEGIALGVVAEFDVVEEGEAVCGVAQVGPALGGDFEFGFLPRSWCGLWCARWSRRGFRRWLWVRWLRVGRRLFRRT